MASMSAASSQLCVALVTETFPPEINGVAMTLGRLTDGLRRRGHEVQVIRPRQRGDDAPGTTGGPSEILVPGLPIPRYPELRMGLARTETLVRAWTRQRPDVVHVATEGPLGWAALSAARRLGIPLSSTYHTHFDAYTRHYGLGWLKNAVTAYLRHFHNRTQATLVPTRDLAQTLAGEGFQRLGVLARGVDTALFRPDRRSGALRAAWGTSDDTPVVLYAGRLAPEKNLPLLEQAFAAIRLVRPEARLLLVGDGPERRRLQERHPDGIFAGMRRGEDLAAHYASADIFLFPSLTETFGNVVGEALASGLAVVAFRRAAAAELIRDGENGRLAPEGDSTAFVEAALQVASAVASSAALRREAPTSVAALDWERIHDDFAGRLWEIARRGGAGERPLALAS